MTENQTFVTVQGIPWYKIGPGDILEILLTRGLTQEKQAVVVKPDAMVTVAFVDTKVAGLTTQQATEEVRRVLSPFYKQLSVEVVVKEYNSKKVTALGALGGKVGTFPLRGRTTILDLLADAGGPGPNADLERVRVLRADGTSLTINLFSLLEDPLTHAFVLDAGDVVFVPSRVVVEEKKVFVLGEVRNPGAFSMLPNMRLSQAIGMAGGPTDLAVLSSARVIRGGLAAPRVIETDFKKVLDGSDTNHDLMLQVGDLIVLPRSTIGNWNAFITKLKPTFEFLTLPLAPPAQLLLIRELLRRDQD